MSNVSTNLRVEEIRVYRQCLDGWYFYPKNWRDEPKNPGTNYKFKYFINFA
jgi:hypothetical protein